MTTYKNQNMNSLKVLVSADTEVSIQTPVAYKSNFGRITIILDDRLINIYPNRGLLVCYREDTNMFYSYVREAIKDDRYSLEEAIRQVHAVAEQIKMIVDCIPQTVNG
jgi:hypothetical protein